MFEKRLDRGTVIRSSSSSDSDIVARLTWSRHSDYVRRIEHEHRVRSSRLVGPTRDGMLRSLLTYHEDVIQTEKGDQVVSTPSAVVGRSYAVDVGPSGVRVLTAEGYTPSPAEVTTVQRDYRARRHTRREEERLRRAPRDVPPPVASPVTTVTATMRQWLEDAEIIVHALQVEVRGLREHHGVRCAVFAVRMQGHAETIEGGEKMRTAIDLGGEYSVRLADGWEAEVVLQGLKRSTGTVRGQGAPYVFDAHGHLRLLMIWRYEASAVRTLDSLDRNALAP